MNRLLKKTRHHLLRLEDLLLTLLLTSMILLATLQILLRNVWEYSISWGDPALRLMVLWLALLGAMAATRDNKHIRIDLLSRFLSPRANRICGLLTDGFAAGICALLAWHSGRFVLSEQADGIRFLDLLPIWPLELIIPIGFGMIGLRLLLNALLGKPPGVAR